MTFGPCQETSKTSITLNPESNFSRREKNHSLFHWNKLTSPELLIRIWMSSKRNASLIIGMSMGQEICLIIGQVSLNLLYWKKNLQTDICGPGRDSGILIGHALVAGWIWKGDVLIADIEELETMDASEIYSKRVNAKEVIFPRQGESIFPIADGRIKTPGGDQELRTPTLIRQRPLQGDSKKDFLGESEGSLPPPHDSLPDAGEAINDFWSMSGNFIYLHHVEPRVKLFSPREESFPIPLK